MSEPRGDAQTFLLPWPVSTNGLWRAFNGRNILSAPARAWNKAAAMELMVQRARPIKGPVTLLIELCSPYGRRFDLSNRIKIVEDLLVKNAVIEGDDDEIVREVIVRAGAYKGARVTVTPVDDEMRPWLAIREKVAA